MILNLISRVVKSRLKPISFPKLPTKEYNKLWKITINKFIKLPIIEIMPIIRCLMSGFGANSLLTIPAIYWIIQK